MNWEGEEGRKQGREEEKERMGVGGSVEMKGSMREERKGKGKDGNERRDEQRMGMGEGCLEGL